MLRYLLFRGVSRNANDLLPSISFLTTSSDGSCDGGEILRVLNLVKDGLLSVSQAQQQIIAGKTSDEPLTAFANLDYRRSRRVGFPEAVFAQSKKATQVAMILDSMAQRWQTEENDRMTTPILATRVTDTMYQDIQGFAFQNGSIKYYDQARIIAMQPKGCDPPPRHHSAKRIVVVTAGTTDIPVAEEAAVTLELSGFPVDRVFDAGVAGLHRILNALPKLTHPDVGCAIVVAGMDGALPSVVGGLVKCPVIAVPTSIGYGACFGGISALLTMLNSCSPGVGVVNIDNGFGAAALAFKCLRQQTDIHC